MREKCVCGFRVLHTLRGKNIFWYLPNKTKLCFFCKTLGFISQSMLLGNSELQLGAALCRLFFFKAFLLSPPSVAGRTHIKQLSEGIEVNICWLAALSGGSVVLGVASKRLLSEKANTALKNRSVWEEFMACLQLILSH